MPSLIHLYLTLPITCITFFYLYTFLKGRNASKEKVVASNLISLIGSTPLIKIPLLSSATGCDILAKVEYVNPGGSCKDRIALSMIESAERKGLITPHSNHVVIEGTVGSTGISLATVCRAKGYQCYIVMPDDQAQEKYQILEKLGAIIEKVKPASIIDPQHFVNVAKQRALEINQSGIQKAFFCMNIISFFRREILTSDSLLGNQFENLDNFQAHYTTTGPEIYKQTKGRIDALVLGAGTGGTISGCSIFLKEKLPHLQVFLADPQGSGLYHKVKHNVMFSPTEAEGSRKRHQVDSIVEGVGMNRMTANLEKGLEWIDDAIKVSDKEAIDMSRKLLENDGFFIGSSSSVNCVAALKVAEMLGPGHVIITMLCDHGSRHLTKFWNDSYPVSGI